MSTTLSSRGSDADTVGAKESLVWNAISNVWHPVSNPHGYVSLGVAENALMHDDLRGFLNSKNLVGSSNRALTYGDGPSGSNSLKDALSAYFNEKFRPAEQITAGHLMITNGVSSGIEHCAWVLADPNQGILLGRPYYRAFLPDMSLRTGAKVVTVAFGTVDPFSLECVSKYEEALIASNAEGVEIRALMLCHPHNPLGRCYPKETLLGLMKLCEKYSIHLISDEIYALSVWRNTIDLPKRDNFPFESVLSIKTDDIIDPQRVHVLWGASKDFGANGIRIGVIISQSNKSFLTACRRCALYSYPSSLAENALLEVLSDKTFLGRYMETNGERLSDAYSYAIHLLRVHSIPYQGGANAAFFLWVDLGRKYLKSHPESTDTQDVNSITGLIAQLLMEKKVFIVSGDAAGAEKPGWFRLVFAQPKHLVEEGIKRISAAVS